MAHLLGDLVHHRVGGIAQPCKEITEPGIAVFQAVELLIRVEIDVAAHQGVKLLLVHLGKAAPA